MFRRFKCPDYCRPVDNSVITISKTVGGTRYNVGVEVCEMEGTCRNLNPAVRDVIPDRNGHFVPAEASLKVVFVSWQNWR